MSTPPTHKTTTYKLHDWISLANLDPNGLCGNPAPPAMLLLDRYWQQVTALMTPAGWENLCSNSNPLVIGLIDKHWETVRPQVLEHWHTLCAHPNIVQLLKNRWEELRPIVNWPFLCSNPSAEAIAFVDQHWETDVKPLCRHTCVYNLCNHLSARAMELLEKRWDEIQPELYWHGLCGNPAALPLLRKHWDEMVGDNDDDGSGGEGCCNMDWGALAQNPAIFVEVEQREEEEKGPTPTPN